jgi:hypothetical protein
VSESIYIYALVFFLSFCRYEQGLEDYDEAVARISEEDEKEEANKINPYLSIVGMLLEQFIGRSLNKRSTTTESESGK